MKVISAANSRIRDADIAEESAEFTSSQILAASFHRNARTGKPIKEAAALKLT